MQHQLRPPGCPHIPDLVTHSQGCPLDHLRSPIAHAQPLQPPDCLHEPLTLSSRLQASFSGVLQARQCQPQLCPCQGLAHEGTVHCPCHGLTHHLSCPWQLRVGPCLSAPPHAAAEQRDQVTQVGEGVGVHSRCAPPGAVATARPAHPWRDQFPPFHEQSGPENGRRVPCCLQPRS